MKNVFAALAIFVVVGIASWGTGQDVDKTVCEKTIKTSCTTCHNTDRICHELNESDAKWPELVKEMGERGNLSQDVQDTVLKCLTNTEEPKEFVCTK